MNDISKKNFSLVIAVQMEGSEDETLLVFTQEMIEEICVNFNSYCYVELQKMLTAFPDSPQMDLFKSLYTGLISSLIFKFDLYRLMVTNDKNEFNRSAKIYFNDLNETLKKYKKGNLK